MTEEHTSSTARILDDQRAIADFETVAVDAVTENPFAVREAVLEPIRMGRDRVVRSLIRFHLDDQFPGGARDAFKVESVMGKRAVFVGENESVDVLLSDDEAATAADTG